MTRKTASYVPTAITMDLASSNYQFRHALRRALVRKEVPESAARAISNGLRINWFSVEAAEKPCIRTAKTLKSVAKAEADVISRYFVATRGDVSACQRCNVIL